MREIRQRNPIPCRLLLAGLIVTLNVYIVIKVSPSKLDFSVLHFQDLQTQITQETSQAKTELTDLQHVFSQRRARLQQKCRQWRNKDNHSATNDLPATAWLDSMLLQTPNHLKLCIPPKVGSSSWRKLNKRFNNISLATFHSVSAMQVRHPFSRLTSAYRDKYLNGAPISAYDSTWQARTSSVTTWEFRWYHYWLPALISSGRLEPTPLFSSMLKRYDLAFRFISRHYRKEGAALLLPGAGASGFDASTYHVGTHMVTNGRQVGLEHAAREAYGHVDKDLRDIYANATFSFEDFLRFIVWEKDHGVLDVHWTPYVDICFPCRENYDYILHLETVSEEAKALLRDVGYPQDVQLTTEHRIRGISEDLNVSDAKYFEMVPAELLEAIVNIYEADFDLFGYEKDIV